MGVVLVLLCAMASAGCQLLFNLDHIDRVDAAPQSGDTISGPVRFVFTTGVGFTGDLDGLDGADAKCQARANMANLPGTYLAWLSTATSTPAARMTKSDDPYVLVTRTLVARNWADLTDGTIGAPINIDEHGKGVLGGQVCMSGEVWSNTDATGNLLVGGTCTNWTSSVATGAAAHLTETGKGWTEPGCPSVVCQSVLPIYCFQQ